MINSMDLGPLPKIPQAISELLSAESLCFLKSEYTILLCVFYHVYLLSRSKEIAKIITGKRGNEDEIQGSENKRIKDGTTEPIGDETG